MLAKQHVEQLLPDAEIGGDKPRKRTRQIEQSATRGALEETECADGLETMRPRRGNAGPVVYQDRVRPDGKSQVVGGPLARIEPGEPRISVGRGRGLHPQPTRRCRDPGPYGRGCPRMVQLVASSGGISTASAKASMISISPISTR